MPRLKAKDMLPKSLSPVQLGQNFIQNSSVSDITFSIDDAETITVTSRTVSLKNENIRLGTTPFMITFFDADSLSAVNPGTNQIPFDTATGDWTVQGPFAMPNYTVNDERFYLSSGSKIYFATDGNDLVFKTAITNNTGGTENVTALVQTRVIQTVGGGV